MPFKIEKINELIHRRLAEIMARELEFPENSIATILAVEVSKDLQQAKIIISCYPDNQTAEVMALLEKKKGLLKSLLAQEIKFRKIPEINFVAEALHQPSPEL